MILTLLNTVSLQKAISSLEHGMPIYNDAMVHTLC